MDPVGSWSQRQPSGTLRTEYFFAASLLHVRARLARRGSADPATRRLRRCRCAQPQGVDSGTTCPAYDSGAYGDDGWCAFRRGTVDTRFRVSGFRPRIRGSCHQLRRSLEQYLSGFNLYRLGNDRTRCVVPGRPFIWMATLCHTRPVGVPRDARTGDAFAPPGRAISRIG